MKGGDLQTHIGEGPKFISESKAQIIAKKIIESTVIMHSMGIIHQDLKPGVSISLVRSSFSCPVANWELTIEHSSGQQGR